ncbi:MAG: hypothetical protein VBE63_29965 [Lamprobacter sp.]|uniref:endonuclease/exonuclease/phosphatase family protein n=1 Tax=Lamprobacter sp. TaxID=3100796 RepID=UPI002B25A5E1|nr:hypothetical protein [Lamprobacter sp.]MEA3644117.1 hypothetical protein [Lamprobacter sp.]
MKINGEPSRFSRFPILTTQVFNLPSDGKGAGALCASLNVAGSALRACSMHLDEIPHKPRTGDGQIDIPLMTLLKLLA